MAEPSANIPRRVGGSPASVAAHVIAADQNLPFQDSYAPAKKYHACQERLRQDDREAAACLDDLLSTRVLISRLAAATTIPGALG